MFTPGKRMASSAAALLGIVVIGYFVLQFYGIKLDLGSSKISAPDRIQIPSRIQWVAPRQASEEAFKVNRPIFCFFTIASCRPCRRMEQDVLSDAKVCDYINSEFVPVLIIYDDSLPDSATEKIVKRNYEIFNFPTLLITDPGGKKVKQISGFHSKEETLKFLASPVQVPAKKNKR